MIALVDINNFYASCERLFNPSLNGKPIVILSNNDGCAIARSDEAKDMGIEMGMPAFLVQDKLTNKNAEIFSSNYTLYDSMSKRVLHVLESYGFEMETYSIDEAFLEITGYRDEHLFCLGAAIRKKIFNHTGLTVCIGFAPTKALAKMANRFAKKHKKDVGVHVAATKEDIHAMLCATAVGDIWGVGLQHKHLLEQNNFFTAADLVNAPPAWVRKNMSVVGARLVYELTGQKAIKWQDVQPIRKNICTSRAFGNPLTELADLKQAVAAHASSCARKLREEKTCATRIYIFIETNLFRRDHQQFFTDITIPVPVPSNNSNELVALAIRGLEMIYKPGYQYMKAGVMMLDLVAQTAIQLAMFDTRDRVKDQRLARAVDETNKEIPDAVRFAAYGFDRKWQLRRHRLSPCYTTRMHDIMKVKS